MRVYQFREREVRLDSANQFNEVIEFSDARLIGYVEQQASSLRDNDFTELTAAGTGS